MKLFFIFQILIFCACNSSAQNNRNCELDTFQIVINQNIDGYIYKLQNDFFKEYAEKKYMPKFINESLNCLTGGDFSLCNPSEDFINSCTSPRNLPQRQLQYFAVSRNMVALIYLRGTIAVETRIILIAFYGGTILDIWAGSDLYGKTRNKQQLISLLKKKRNKIIDFGFL